MKAWFLSPQRGKQVALRAARRITLFVLLALALAVSNAQLPQAAQAAFTLLGPQNLGVVYTQVSAGYMLTCTLFADGEVQCWGNNGSFPATPALPEGLIYTQVSAGPWLAWV